MTLTEAYAAKPSAIEWCQCEHEQHQGIRGCCCPHIPDSGVRVGTHPLCSIHSPAAHVYADRRRTAAHQTAWGTFQLCAACVDAGHMVSA